MGKHAVDHPLVADWLKASGWSDTARQYAPFVRALVRRASGDPLDLTSADYVDYVLSETKDTRQKKAISALVAFGKYVADVKNSNADPGRDLAAQVRQVSEERAVADSLRRAGLSPTEIVELRWRDILAGIFVGSEPTIGKSAFPKDRNVARHLGQKLLERLRGADVDEIPALLSAPVFSAK